MSTILAYTSPARGHLFPMMDLLIELGARGHRVVVQTLESERDRVVEAGFEHRAIAPEIEALPLKDYEGGNPIEQIRITLGTFLERAPHEVSDLRVAVEEVEPDFLLIDANTFGAAAFAETSGLPWALHMPFCLPTPSRDAPAFGPGFPPPRSALGRLRDGAFRFLFNRVNAGRLRQVNELRRGLGAPRLSTLTEMYDAPPTILYRTAEPFEYPRSDWAPNVEPLGPGLWAPPGEVPEWLAELPRPRVLVNVSTEAQNDAAIVSTAIEALADEPGSVICTTSAHDPGKFDDSADNVRVSRFLPHAEVFPHLDCVVTHGGMGTVQRALAAGLPLCVVPWGRDQSESAQRVVTAQAGTRLNPSRLGPETLRDAVRQALQMEDGAEAVAAGFRRAGGAERGADLVEAALPAAPADEVLDAS